MDSVLEQIANKPSSAAEPQSPQGQITPQADSGGAQGIGSIGIDPQPTQGQAPETGQLPTAGIETPAAPVQQAPAIDPNRYQQALQREAQFNQLAAELQRLDAQAQSERQRQAREGQRQSREDAIYTQAQTMDADAALAFTRQQMAILRAEDQNAYNQELANTQQQYTAAVIESTRPAYAAHLAEQNGLPATYQRRLAMMNPYDMDRYLPVFIQEYQEYKVVDAERKQLKDQLEQVQRSQQANGLQNSGAHNSGGAGSGAPRSTNDSFARGSTDHLLNIPGLANMFGVGNGE